LRFNGATLFSSHRLGAGAFELRVDKNL
jgi:hypothetical protein